MTMRLRRAVVLSFRTRGPQCVAMRARDRLAGMEEFVAVAEAGGFARAGERLGVSASAVGKAVARYGDRLGARLLHRTTRRVSLTPAGEAHMARCRDLLERVERIEEAVGEAIGRLAGPIRIGAPLAYGRLRVPPRLARFREEHPGVALEVRFGDRLADSVLGGLDLVVRVGELADSSVGARRVDRVRLGLFAAPCHLDAYPPIAHPSDVEAHLRLEFVAPSGRPLQAVLARGEERVRLGPDPSFRCDDAESALAAAAMGLGVVYLPSFPAEPAVARGELRPVLEDWWVDGPPAHPPLPQPRLVPARVRRLFDALQGTWEGEPFRCGDR